MTPLTLAKVRLEKVGRFTKRRQGEHHVELLDGVSVTPAEIIMAAAKL